MLKINFFSDPGHGWAAVKIKILVDLKISDQITPYSYMRGKTAYLEEDLDFGTLISALNNAGIEYEIINKITDRRSPIRSYASYVAA